MASFTLTATAATAAWLRKRQRHLTLLKLDRQARSARAALAVDTVSQSGQCNEQADDSEDAAGRVVQTEATTARRRITPVNNAQLRVINSTLFDVRRSCVVVIVPKGKAADGAVRVGAVDGASHTQSNR